MSINSKKVEDLQFDANQTTNENGGVVIGHLAGPVADIVNTTRNGRKYSEELWDKVFKDPITQEYFNCGGIFGELGHPIDREETDMEKIAICMPKAPEKKNGKLWATFDILDTPNGRILKTLCQYGYKMGISSRGSGDLITDYDGQESVDPDTYQFNAFDAVLLPAVKEARLNFTESLHSNKSFKKALTESFNAATSDEKEIMKETLNNLNINLTEDAEETYVVLIPVSEAGRWASEIIPQDIQDHKIIVQRNGEDFANFEKLWPLLDGGHRYPSPDCCSVENDCMVVPCCTSMCPLGESVSLDEERVVKIRWAIKDDNGEGPILTYRYSSAGAKNWAADWLNANHSEFPNAQLIYQRLDRVGNIIDETPIKLDTENVDESLNRLLSEDIDSLIADPKEEAEVREEHAKVLDDIIDAITSAEPEEFNTASFKDTILEILLRFENGQEGEDPDIDGEDSEEVDNNESIIDELQEALKANAELESRVVELQEKLSVCYAKETSLNESLTSTKDNLSKLANNSKKAKALDAKVSRLTEQLEEKDKKLEATVSNRKALQERLSSSVKQTNSLKEQVKTLQEEADKLNKENAVLTESVANLQKDIELKKSEYSKKLNESNSTAEKQRKIANKAVDKYIESQATRIGVSSNEIKNKLPESYTFNDIDKICEDLQSYQLNMSKLPFNTSIRENLKMKATSSQNEYIKPANTFADDVDTDLLQLAGL